MKSKATHENNGQKKHHRLLVIIALVLIALAVLLVIWSFLAQIEALKEQYAELRAFLTRIELYIASLENKWLLIFIIFLLYALKGFLPILPLSAMFIISGMVFQVQYATAINILGVAILVSMKFFWGNKFGGGGFSKLISHFRLSREFMQLEGTGNPWMLFLARLLPFAPVNTVSRLYGASEIQYDKYLLISLLGFAPRILSFSVLGNNVFDPFSVGFLVPIIVLLFVSGFSMLILDLAILLFGKKKKFAD